MELITFIIPSIGRPTLERTIRSLQAMTDPYWKAIIVFDGIHPTLGVDDERITMISVQKTGMINHAGQVRNYGISLATTPWVGFVDDDDSLQPEYMTHVRQHIEEEDPDVVIFRMLDHGKILPPLTSTDFCINQVGISFCVKRVLCVEEECWFIPCGCEDFVLLDRIRNKGKKIFMSPHVDYLVRM